jgi:hypothetical protein
MTFFRIDSMAADDLDTTGFNSLGDSCFHALLGRPADAIGGQPQISAGD